MVVLLGLFNGARYITEQLDSIADQSLPPCEIIVSDDGSTDDGPALVAKWGEKNLPVTLRPGPRRGFARNFLHLIQHAPENADYVALSDQDDVWLKGKLARAQSALETVPFGTPALYCGRTWVCDAQLNRLHKSRRRMCPPGFRNALTQSISGGNTMVMNRAALDLARRAGTSNCASHDWWLYQLVTGAGGQVIYDPVPYILYRQHDANVIGANSGFAAKVKRLRMIWAGRLRKWTDINITALQNARSLLTPENAALLRDFREARKRPLIRRIRCLIGIGLYRQSRTGTLAILLAAAIGRF